MQDKDRLEDIAYTLNHSLACTASDWAEPYINHWAQKKIGMRFPLGCGHDHHHGTGCNHSHHTHAEQSKLMHWVLGEFAGDFGAVPVTIAIQRFAPHTMETMRHIIEPVAKPLFSFGANNSARKWASNNGLSKDSKECKEKAAEIYEHEMRHLPQAVIWTAASIGINFATQRGLGNKSPVWQMLASKAVGASISAGGVVGARSMMPETARRWDQFTSQKLFLPATKAIGGFFGVDADTVDSMADNEKKHSAQNWVERVKTPDGKSNITLS